MNVANRLTIFRILLIPLFVFFMLASQWNHSFAAAFVLFVIASATDWLDGYWARKNHQVTDFGKFLDPIADKLLVLCAMICLNSHGLCDPVVIMIVLARELMVSSLRLVAASQSVVIAAEMWGKVKTASQMFSISMLLMMLWLNQSFQIALPVEAVSRWLMGITACLAVYSGMDYLLRNRHLINTNR